VSGALSVLQRCRAHLSHRGAPVACVIRPEGGGGRAQVGGLSVYRVQSAAVRWRRGRGGRGLPCVVRVGRYCRGREPRAAVVEAAAGRQAGEGAGQEGRKPCVIAPLRPLSNSRQTTSRMTVGRAQGHRMNWRYGSVFKATPHGTWLAGPGGRWQQGPIPCPYGSAPYECTTLVLRIIVLLQAWDLPVAMG
jgi:hypothetical protein